MFKDLGTKMVLISFSLFNLLLLLLLMTSLLGWYVTDASPGYKGLNKTVILAFVLLVSITFEIFIFFKKSKILWAAVLKVFLSLLISLTLLFLIFGYFNLAHSWKIMFIEKRNLKNIQEFRNKYSAVKLEDIKYTIGQDVSEFSSKLSSSQPGRYSLYYELTNNFGVVLHTNTIYGDIVSGNSAALSDDTVDAVRMFNEKVESNGKNYIILKNSDVIGNLYLNCLISVKEEDSYIPLSDSMQRYKVIIVNNL